MFKIGIAKGESVIKIWLVAAAVLVVVSGCSPERETKARLECVVSGVVDKKTGSVVEINKADAIKNGFEYHFRFKNNDTVTVQGADRAKGTDIYVKDANSSRSYSLQREKKVDTNMKFQFNEAFNDVRFLIVDKGVEYTYVCVQKKPGKD